jgi:hypothetical protein
MTEDNQVHHYCKLVDAMKETTRSRFKAHRRLQSLDRKLTWLTALASSYVVIITVSPCYLNYSATAIKQFDLLTVALSIIIIVTSLLQFASQNGVVAEQHHRCALEINEVRRDLEFAGSHADVSPYTARYNAALQKYSVNHEDVDYNRVRLERRHEHPELNGWGALSLRAGILFSDYLVPIITVLLTILVLYCIAHFENPPLF